MKQDTNMPNDKDKLIEELKSEIRKLRKKVDAEINSGLIRAFEMKKGKKYVLIFGRNNGLYPEDIARINDPHFVDTMFIVDDISKVDQLDADRIKKHFNL